ncbi:MAG: KamA family radical SAM protein [Methanomassiliicoccales archaeon]
MYGENEFPNPDGKEGIDLTYLRDGGRPPLVRSNNDLPFNLLERIDPEFFLELSSSQDLQDCRERLIALARRREAFYHSCDCVMEPLERSNALNCLRVLRNLLSERNERLTGVSPLATIWELKRRGSVSRQHQCFFLDLLHILQGTRGRSNIYFLIEPSKPDTRLIHGPSRFEHLDELAYRCLAHAMSYASGLDSAVIKKREEHKKRILDALGSSAEDWKDYSWHLKNIFRQGEDIEKIIQLSPEEKEAIRVANENEVPFGITPYYLSLMDHSFHGGQDHAIRAQVIPTMDYLEEIIPARRMSRDKLDFMQENKTTPVELVGRRYPLIAIFKPYNSCAQICSYCQRNWEIKGPLDPNALASDETMEAAFRWFESHEYVQEVLVTGGDPLVMSDELISRVLSRLAAMRHIRRIRLGTRLPVVLPMRFTETLAEIISGFHEPGKREVCLVTHFEHPYEVTPDSMLAIQSLRKRGLMVYNQQVFTIENCRRFETVALRLALKQIGVDPYYMFNTKGKEETRHFRVPIARILQEVKEESRLVPGLVRTDEPVFNIPALGKNHLRAWQHHDLLTISPEGERIYEFHPWEKNISPAPTFIYRDVPIAEFLERLAKRGENPENYSSIWYYF